MGKACMKTSKFLGSILLLMALVPWVTAEVTITRHPTNTTVSVGANVQFTVTVAYTGLSMTYRWRFNEASLDPASNRSATTPVLSLTDVTLAHAGAYDVEIADASGSVTSQAATLKVDGTFTKITQGPVATDVESPEAPIWWDYDHDWEWR